MTELQKQFEDWVKGELDVSDEFIPWHYEDVKLLWYGWKHAHERYSQDSQKYIDVLRDLYYTHGYELPDGSFQKIEKVLGDLL